MRRLFFVSATVAMAAMFASGATAQQNDDMAARLDEILARLDTLSQRVDALEAGAQTSAESGEPVRVQGLNLSVWGLKDGEQLEGTAPTSVGGMTHFGDIALENPLPFSFGAYTADPRLNADHAERVRALIWDGYITLPDTGQSEIRMDVSAPQKAIGCTVQIHIDGIPVINEANHRFGLNAEPVLGTFSGDAGTYSFKLYLACNAHHSHRNIQHNALPLSYHGGTGVSLSITPEGGQEAIRLGSRLFTMRAPD